MYLKKIHRKSLLRLPTVRISGLVDGIHPLSPFHPRPPPVNPHIAESFAIPSFPLTPRMILPLTSCDPFPISCYPSSISNAPFPHQTIPWLNIILCRRMRCGEAQDTVPCAHRSRSSPKNSNSLKISHRKWMLYSSDLQISCILVHYKADYLCTFCSAANTTSSLEATTNHKECIYKVLI